MSWPLVVLALVPQLLSLRVATDEMMAAFVMIPRLISLNAVVTSSSKASDLFVE